MTDLERCESEQESCGEYLRAGHARERFLAKLGACDWIAEEVLIRKEQLALLRNVCKDTSNPFISGSGE